MAAPNGPDLEKFARGSDLGDLVFRENKPVFDVTRVKYSSISKKQSKYARKIKEDFNLVLARLSEVEAEFGPDRMMALAKTRAEEASMWAVKSVTRVIPAEQEAIKGEEK